jgi:transcriptional regulator with XRE-family HTH domain
MKAKRLASLLSNLKGANSQAWLAKEMSVTPSRLGTYMRGEVDNISVDFLCRLANYMDIGVDELVRILEGNPQQKTRLKEEDVFVTFEDLLSSLDCLDTRDIPKAIHYLSKKLTEKLIAA